MAIEIRILNLEAEKDATTTVGTLVSFQGYPDREKSNSNPIANTKKTTTRQQRQQNNQYKRLDGNVVFFRVNAVPISVQQYSKEPLDDARTVTHSELITRMLGSD
jgi:hypothetical protein